MTGHSRFSEDAIAVTGTLKGWIRISRQMFVDIHRGTQLGMSGIQELLELFRGNHAVALQVLLVGTVGIFSATAFA